MAGQRYRAFIIFIVAMAYWGLLAQGQAALNVIVYDSHNQPVNSLSINDFQVYDQNKLRQIVFLRRDDVTQKPTASGPDQYSNRTGKAAFHATVILFDLLNLSGSDGNDALTRLVSSIQSESSGNLYFYFLTATGGIEPVHGLPQTETDVGETGTTWAQQIRPRFNQAQHAVADINARAEMTYRAVGALAQQLRSVPGRKDIVWITAGVPTQTMVSGFHNFVPTLEQLGSQLARTSIAINPVYERSKAFSGMDALEQLAGLTGGKWYTTGDVGKAIAEVTALPLASYWIDYVSPPPDGKYHKIRVVCARKGTHLQVKQGYYAYPSEAARDEDRAAFLEDAASSVFDASGVGLRAAISADANSPQAVDLSVWVDAADVRLLPQGGGYTSQLNVTLVSYTSDGRPTESPTNTVKVSLTREQHDESVKDGIPIGKFVLNNDAIRKIRIIIMDPASDGAGWLTVPLPERAGTEIR
jgi:VWFA-related protein